MSEHFFNDGSATNDTLRFSDFCFEVMERLDQEHGESFGPLREGRDLWNTLSESYSLGMSVDGTVEDVHQTYNVRGLCPECGFPVARCPHSTQPTPESA